MHHGRSAIAASAATADADPRGQRHRVIITADDFGRAHAINEAVLQAFQEGTLTSASLMVTGDAFEEAVQMARSVPSLAVGLHLVLVCGRSALPPPRIPHLVDDAGRFPDSPVRAGLRYFFHPAARAELGEEISAQFERFARTGLPLAHVDGHLHLHLHPVVLSRLLPLAKRYGAGGVRVPRDRLGLALRFGGDKALNKVGLAVAFGLLGAWGRRRLRAANIPCASACCGVLRSGSIDEAYLVRLLEAAVEPSVEIHLHPTTGERVDRRGPNPGDLAALVSPAVRDVVRRRNLTLCAYPSLRETEGDRP